MNWMRDEAKDVDLRDRLGEVKAPALVLAGEDDAWAPLDSAQEVADLLGGTVRFRSFPGARHSIFRDEPHAYEELRAFLDDVQAVAP
jgi:3-oxoadipate enol-lactonase